MPRRNGKPKKGLTASLSKKRGIRNAESVTTQILRGKKNAVQDRKARSELRGKEHEDGKTKE